MERIPLENDHLEGANNVYLFDAGPETVLVDTGSPGTGRALRSALETHGVSFADVDEVLLTHWHPDHSGLATEIHEESGATVRIHRADAPVTDDDMDELHTEQRSVLESWGVPDEKRQEIFARHDDTGDGPRLSFPPVSTFEDGDEFALGEVTLEVRHTPGHTDGSVCFVCHDSGDPDGSGREVLAGDTLLPQYTPNVGGSDVRVEHPLEQYVSSLRTVIDGEFDRAWPGHRDPIDDPAGRARDILAHHEERAGKILDILEREGAADVWTVASELFGELEAFHVLVGAGEAYAHLEHLDRQDVLVEVDGTYRLDGSGRPDADADCDVLSRP